MMELSNRGHDELKDRSTEEWTVTPWTEDPLWSVTDMRLIAKKRFDVHEAASVALLVLLMLAAATADPFHSEQYQGTPAGSERSDPGADGDECPACKHISDHNTTYVDAAQMATVLNSISLSRFRNHVNVLHRSQGRYSITSRASPLITTSWCGIQGVNALPLPQPRHPGDAGFAVRRCPSSIPELTGLEYCG